MGVPLSPLQIAAALPDYWSPKVIAELDEHYVKVAKVKGELTWHAHADEDELFYILSGCLHIQMQDQTVILNSGEMFVVPAGVEHNPIATQPCLILLVVLQSNNCEFSVPVALCSKAPCAGNGRSPWPARERRSAAPRERPKGWPVSVHGCVAPLVKDYGHSLRAAPCPEH